MVVNKNILSFFPQKNLLTQKCKINLTALLYSLLPPPLFFQQPAFGISERLTGIIGNFITLKGKATNLDFLLLLDLDLQSEIISEVQI